MKIIQWAINNQRYSSLYTIYISSFYMYCTINNSNNKYFSSGAHKFRRDLEEENTVEEEVGEEVEDEHIHPHEKDQRTRVLDNK